MTKRPEDLQAGSLSSTGNGRVVLVVEDEEPLRAVIRRLLQREGYTVLEADNGAHALQLLEGAWWSWCSPMFGCR